jgi:IclR family transcriptional regulator, pca regulon regulatory protein
MIQVVERIGKIIDILAENEKGISLANIEKNTGLNKGTLCNLLKSLTDIGYVEKSGSGIYRLGCKLREIAYPQFISDNLVDIANQYAKRLSRQTQESGLAVIRQDGELKIIAKYVYDQNIVINSQVFSCLPGYNTAIGYTFLAFDSAIDYKEVFNNCFVNEYNSIGEFLGIIEDIKIRKYHFFEILGRQAHALAVPVFRNKKMILALGMLVPDFRLNSDQKNKFIKILKQAANDMSEELTSCCETSP